MQAKYSINVFSKGNNTKVTPHISRFPDGTVGVDVKGIPLVGDYVVIQVQGYEPDLINILMQIQDATRAHGSYFGVPFALYLPYLPHARYDRHMSDTDSHALKMFALQLNALGFADVYVIDPHSTVAEGLIDNIVVSRQLQVVSKMEDLMRMVSDADYIVAPDMGAFKKASAVSEKYKKPLVILNKVRDLTSGEITGLEVLNNYEFKATDRMLIVDDLCDGGRTFIEAAKCLRERGSESVSLYVTHGIFSAGVLKLLSNGIQNVYCTNSFSDLILEAFPDGRVKQLDVLSMVNL
ncbi:ribose-phosphate pyrophosphokinase [Yersinia phage vB_YenM_P778]